MGPAAGCGYDVWVAFDSLAIDRTVLTLAVYARPGVDLSPGARVRVGDEAGNRADAVVVGGAGKGLIRLRVGKVTRVSPARWPGGPGGQ
jgi:hypothetical protein